MAALLFAAAVLILVAANWEAIPRLGRVGALFALIAGSYLGGAFLHLRGHAAFGDAAWLVAAAASAVPAHPTRIAGASSPDR